MEHIYVIGFMGSGKTTASQIAGDMLSMPVRDIDCCIEEQYGKIQSIFKQEGEDMFRKYETHVLKATLEDETIISTGGGIVENRENITYMHYNGTVLYLQASFETISKRLQVDTNRPLWNTGEAAQRALYNRRVPMYEQAAHQTIDTNERTPGEVAEEMIRLYKALNA